jgi:molybdopterin biosynthesis enzyme
LIFGLPGNPVSAAVTFQLFARRAVLGMQGARHTSLRSGFAVAAKRGKGTAERDTFLPAAIDTNDAGQTIATPLKWLGSSDFIGFAKAEALIFIPAGSHVAEGDVVRTFKI